MSVEDFIKKQGKVDQKLLDEVEKKLGKKLSRRLGIFFWTSRKKILL